MPANGWLYVHGMAGKPTLQFIQECYNQIRRELVSQKVVHVWFGDTVQPHGNYRADMEATHA